MRPKNKKLVGDGDGDGEGEVRVGGEENGECVRYIYTTNPWKYIIEKKKKNNGAPGPVKNLPVH